MQRDAYQCLRRRQNNGLNAMFSARLEDIVCTGIRSVSFAADLTPPSPARTSSRLYGRVCCWEPGLDWAELLNEPPLLLPYTSIQRVRSRYPA